MRTGVRRRHLLHREVFIHGLEFDFVRCPRLDPFFLEPAAEPQKIVAQLFSSTSFSLIRPIGQDRPMDFGVGTKTGDLVNSPETIAMPGTVTYGGHECWW